MKIQKQIAATLLLLLALLLCIPALAAAAGSIEAGREVRLTISYQDGKTPLSGAAFDIYRVAAVDTSGELTPVAPFDNFNVDIRGKNNIAWKALASTLEGYVLRDGISPTDSGETNLQGQLYFPNQAGRLEQGLYLVLGHRHTQDGRIYDATPFMVMLPTQDTQSNEWLYELIVNPKHDSRPEPGTGTCTLKALKVWDDKGYEKNRPGEVIVRLLRDGQVYDTVVLNAANNWRYIWENLDDRSTWTLVEEKVDGYTVSITREGVTFVVTNTYVPETPNTPPPTEPGKPDQPSLPQTGQLWWPVPLLLVGGLLLVVIGLIRRRGIADEQK